MYESGDLRKGLKIEIDGEPYEIVDFEFVKPGKGQALYKCKLKNMITGVQFDKTYRSGEKINKADLEEQQVEYLYTDGEHYYFMNSTTYDQEAMSAEQLGEWVKYLKENTRCDMLFFQGKPIGISLPNFIDLRVVSADPWVKGDTASGGYKPAELETGLVVQVPPFVEEGQKIRVDTRTGQYVERVKE
ncbi:MAG: elongation factor P [Desulfosalsimonas sp.]